MGFHRLFPISKKLWTAKDTGGHVQYNTRINTQAQLGEQAMIIAITENMRTIPGREEIAQTLPPRSLAMNKKAAVCR
ncbi:hypothetical protein D3C77_443170 [compost metagenome]